MNVPVKTQIALAHPADVVPCSEAGVDIIAFVADPKKLSPSSLDVAQSREVLSEIPSGHQSTAIVFSSDVEEIHRLVDVLQPDFLQLAAGTHRLPVSKLERLQPLRAKTKIILAVGVNDAAPLECVRRIEGVVDCIILDTNDPSRVDVGATGEVHDWGISAEITSESAVPTMLAGGLSAENVAMAVQTVRPWAVDSFSLTNRNDEPLRKDLHKVATFARRAREA